jgi:hypothetical protein
MTRLQDLPTRELQRLRKRFASSIFADYRGQVELELIRRAERVNHKIAWITLGLIAVGIWVIVGSAFGLMEVPH